MSNFDFFKDLEPNILYEYAIKAEEYLNSDLDASANNLRKSAEIIVLEIYKKQTQKEPKCLNLNKIIHDYDFIHFVQRYDILINLETIRKIGNIGSHSQTSKNIFLNKSDICNGLRALFEIFIWFFKLDNKNIHFNTYISNKINYEQKTVFISEYTTNNTKEYDTDNETPRILQTFDTEDEVNNFKQINKSINELKERYPALENICISNEYNRIQISHIPPQYNDKIFGYLKREFNDLKNNASGIYLEKNITKISETHLHHRLDFFIYEYLKCQNSHISLQSIKPYDTNDKIKNYLGKYFYRSVLENNYFLNRTLDTISIDEKKEIIQILDLGCGTGGASIGILWSIQKFYPKVKYVKIIGLDKSSLSLFYFKKIIDFIQDECIFNFEISLTTHLYDLTILKPGLLTNNAFDFIVSSKVMNELDSTKFSYYNLLENYLKKLQDNGIFYILDNITPNISYPVDYDIEKIKKEYPDKYQIIPKWNLEYNKKTCPIKFTCYKDFLQFGAICKTKEKLNKNCQKI